MFSEEIGSAELADLKDSMDPLVMRVTTPEHLGLQTLQPSVTL